MNETIRARSLVILRLNLLVIAIGIVLGGLAAPIWHSMVTLPTYTVGSDGAASTTEKGLTQVFSTDAVYCFIGLVVGLHRLPELGPHAAVGSLGRLSGRDLGVPVGTGVLVGGRPHRP